MAAVQVAGGGAALDRVGVAAVRRQAVDAAHDQLPLLAVGRMRGPNNWCAIRCATSWATVCSRKCSRFSRYSWGLKRSRFSSRWATPAFWPRRRKLTVGRGSCVEEVFGLPIAGLDAGVEVFGHSGRLQQRAIMPETGGRAQASGRPLVRGAGSGKRGGGQKTGRRLPAARSYDAFAGRQLVYSGPTRCPRGSPTGRSSPPAPPGPPPAPSWRTGSLRPCGCS